ncbi:hypothetical protein [Streptomyces sp. NBC_01361]|uniref:hypothetical protein n=1 Tax=Streptomyces sp. NBC_01361 TaxID=2903838 RepID=UPI002E3695D6|nr:hypothetical protein [Streptomyces sp. NBC_01361]
MDTGSQFYTTWRRMVDGYAAPPQKDSRPSRVPKLQAVAGVEGIVPHGGRHSMKVWLDERRHPRAAVEARMRHVLAGVEGVYSHVTLRMERDIAADLQELWKQAPAVVDVDR